MFGKVIRDFLNAYEPLKEYLEIYETSEDGRRVYNDCLEATNKYFPQYLVELKGMATGADVSFHKFIGHNEDILSATINRFYIVSVHIKPKGEEGGEIFSVREEKWVATTYAGSLPGYASGYNFHGLVFTINTIFAKKLNNKQIHYEELKESGWQRSVAREKTFEELMLQKPITSLSDILRILGSTRGGEWQIFRDRPNDFVNTINLGVFDFTEKRGRYGQIIH